MLVVLANDLPPAVRGRMKLWFVEPRPNVFVSGVKDSVAVTVVDYLYKHCQPESGLLIVRTIKQTPGFEMRCIGPPRKPMIEVSGLQLIVETLKL
ncbi:type I-E CRISPR-associated endoribonuclease Cas2 [Acidithiobacillus sp. VAN18-1]|uniref:Type I-E CRISPR-associated endoribonuclease Cas2 n=1 Tax=Igneacidithiobacillus copahuensis TaxID=2724909 RepID=A0AAE2YQL5_9PROT|nr:type I-E CRISPR-associated endoribonuclease Cas2e [Igneacidithiobacillus copahuensis]MBU2788186.1 type I-E CRISPR-associated endoribonuclease Cas2 [Igneacidithiobacillus copahuensis]MBU2797031.1 type I-E CRISPR-associated endoribonuclease Cas2 [Acidithiobacillus sp. VAN18-2]